MKTFSIPSEMSLNCHFSCKWGFCCSFLFQCRTFLRENVIWRPVIILSVRVPFKNLQITTFIKGIEENFILDDGVLESRKVFFVKKTKEKDNFRKKSAQKQNKRSRGSHLTVRWQERFVSNGNVVLVLRVVF